MRAEASEEDITPNKQANVACGETG
jgi:hypothetical protein